MPRALARRPLHICLFIFARLHLSTVLGIGIGLADHSLSLTLKSEYIVFFSPTSFRWSFGYSLRSLLVQKKKLNRNWFGQCTLVAHYKMLILRAVCTVWCGDRSVHANVEHLDRIWYYYFCFVFDSLVCFFFRWSVGRPVACLLGLSSTAYWLLAICCRSGFALLE